MNIFVLFEVRIIWMSKINKLILIAIIVGSTLNAGAQRWKRSRAEFAFGAGATNFLGELGGANKIGTNGFMDFDAQSIRPAININYSYKVTQGTAVQLDLYYARLYGSDKYTKEIFRNNRNLTFRTPVVEFAAKYQFYLSKEKRGHIYNLKGVKGLKNIQIISYLTAGIGVFYFNPRGEINGKWYSLQPLSTEGQGLYPTRKKYHRVQPTIPVGFGFKYLINRSWMVGIEYTLHKTFTDYMDDVSTTYPNEAYLAANKGAVAAQLSNPSPTANDPTNPLYNSTTANQQRGDPKDKDAFMLAVVTLRYKIPYSRRFLGIPKF